MPHESNYAFVGAFVDELCRSGLKHVCLSPGSRSTPLALTVAASKRLKTWVHLDERSSAYFALGMARATGNPVALVCTSGTAAANYLPAVAEARYGNVPLLVLTADRPPELLGCGANQAIDQIGIYGSHVKWSVNLPVPEATPGLFRYARAVACRAMAFAARPAAGPVHVNMPFREPLVPDSICLEQMRSIGSGETWEGRALGRTYSGCETGSRRLARRDLEQAVARLERVPKGIIVCGPQFDPLFAPAVATLASKLGYPVLADPLSQVRCGLHRRDMVIDCYDAFLRDPDTAGVLAPEVILQFGAPPTSKALSTYLEHNAKAQRIVVQDDEWIDPLHSADEIIWASPARFAHDMAELSTSVAGRWAERWLAVNTAARDAIDKAMSATDCMFEGKIFTELGGILPSRVCLFSGNSMPVRDMDSFFPGSAKQVRFFCNRGASGIDGVVSSALGVSAVAEEHLVLVIGDLSFYHDMNGLLAARLHGLDATMIVVNNDGGGIFSFLPQSEHPEFFEECFGTPHGLTFGAAASLYGLGYARVNAWGEFRTEVARSINSSGTTIIELTSRREGNVELHRGIWAAVARATACTARSGY